MMMRWNLRRRPTLLHRILRSALMIGAAACVPVSIEVVRRMIRGGRQRMFSPRPQERNRSTTPARSRRRRSAVLPRGATS